MSGTLKGADVLAFIPKKGIFVWKGKFYFAMQFYPVAERDDAHGIWYTTIPPNYCPTMRVVCADWKGWKNVISLWPSSQKSLADESIVWRFVSSA